MSLDTHVYMSVIAIINKMQLDTKRGEATARRKALMGYPQIT